jgi:hypothetical protein
MSYWYERISKKHVAVLLMNIPLIMINNIGQISGSYAAGSLATASRTLYDWISVERAFNTFEVYPYVPMSLDTGCIEWLGFSTCETAQFTDWMPIWMQGETDSLHIFNFTVTNQMQFQSSLMPPVIIDRIIADAGTMPSFGELTLKRHVTLSHKLDVAQLNQIVVTTNPEYRGSGVSEPWKSMSLLEFLSGVVYQESYPALQNHEKMMVPSPIKKGVKTLYYITGTSKEDKSCIFDDDCGQQCAWSGTCNPQLYGHHGFVLPSASFMFNWKGAFELGHWPMVAWKYGLYCPAVTDEQDECISDPRPLIIFHPETFTRTIFYNSGRDGDSEKFPDLDLFVWKAQQYVRRDICGDSSIGSQEKDCGIPQKYVFIGHERYASFPESLEGAAYSSEVHSERVTGLRFDYVDFWQINQRMMMQNGEGAQFVPLFWVQRQPVTIKMNENLQFSVLRTYGGSMLRLAAVAWVVYLVAYFGWLAAFFYGISCVDFCKHAEEKYKPFAPVYI